MTTQDSTPSFARDIKPLFRTRDQLYMRWAFDLGNYHSVSTHAQRILERLASGTMPCDGKWPEGSRSRSFAGGSKPACLPSAQ